VFDELVGLLFILWNRDRVMEGAAWAAELQRKPVVDPSARIVALGFAALIMNNIDLSDAETFAKAAEQLWSTTDSVPPTIAISVLSTVELMRGRTDAAIANCEHLRPLAADEPDLFIRAHALAQCHTVLSLCGGLDLWPDLQRDVSDLVERLGNLLLLGTFTLSLGIAASSTDPEGSAELLLQSYTLNDEYGAKVINVTAAMFLALHDLNAGHHRQAARWTRRALELAVTYGPAYIAQGLNITIPIVKRQAPNDAAVLLGALRAHRARRDQTGSEQ